MRKDEVRFSVCGFCAVLAGICSGLTGLGGGAVMLLLLKGIYKGDELKAFASVTAVVLPMTVICSAIYCINDPDVIFIALPYLPFAIAGGCFGAFLIGRIKPGYLTAVFSALTVFAGMAALLS